MAQRLIQKLLYQFSTLGAIGLLLIVLGMGIFLGGKSSRGSSSRCWA